MLITPSKHNKVRKIIRKDSHKSKSVNKKHLLTCKNTVLVTLSHVANNFSCKSPGKFDSHNLNSGLIPVHCRPPFRGPDWSGVTHNKGSYEDISIAWIP